SSSKPSLGDRDISVPEPEPETQQAGAAVDLAIGYDPHSALSPQDEALFKAFQSNLLSLVSHELRTPLTGILNALSVLDEGALLQGISQEDLIKMARENALRLHQALTVLLDLATLESGNFQARLREVDLNRILATRLELHQPLLKAKNITLEFLSKPHSNGASQEEGTSIVLADPAKLGRAIDLCLQVAIPRCEKNSRIALKVTESGLRIRFELSKAMEKLWETSWSQSLAGFQAGVASPHSAFGGVMQSEQAFLSRVEDGFGSEFLLIHEIMKLHGGKFSAVLNDQIAELTIEIPELESEQALRAVLKSRAYQASHELGAVTLILVEVPQKMELKSLKERILQNLFRTTDTVYLLPEKHLICLVLDDCKASDAPKVMSKIGRNLGLSLNYGVSHCPSDTLDPEKLIELSQKRLEKMTSQAA
ncbi:MAG: hypothetical protein HYX41_05830, partial [Bdellovibrio sp.]|nr:hypothetical protein [Bdellovibrio sp.]